MERGLPIYLKTALHFKQNHQSLKMLIIGEFRNKSTEKIYHNFVIHHQLSDYVTHIPYVPHTDVLKEISKAKIGLFFADIEKSPRYDKAVNMKIFEYFSQGIPVIISDLTMLSDYVIKSEAGWIVKYDSYELYNLLQDILHDDNLLKQKGLKGYEYVQNNHLWEHVELLLYKAVFGE